MLCAVAIALVLPLAAGSPADPAVLSTDRARVFAVPSAEAFAALERVLARYDLPLEAKDPEGGVLRTRSRPLSRLVDSGLDASRLVAGAHAVSFEVHAFVSRALEPAHVHVDTRVSVRRGGGRATVVSPGPLGAWLLDALAAELGSEGGPVSLQEPLLDCTRGEMHPPQIIRASKLFPHYPESARLAGSQGKVTMQVRILADGSVLPESISVVQGASAQLDAASVAAVQLWRYRPARSGTCPVAYETTVATSFSQDRRPTSRPRRPGRRRRWRAPART